jgi:hypothetical protein
VDREVHLRQADGVARLLLSEDRQLLSGREPVALDEVGGVDEHTARATRGVEDPTVEGFDDLDDEPDDRGGREELARAPTLGQRELAEEVLVDQAEGVAFEILRVAVDVAQQRRDRRVLDRRVGLREDTREIGVVPLDRPHRIVDRLPESGGSGETEEVFEARGLGEVNHPLRLVVRGADLAAGGRLRLDARSGLLELRVGEA